jgi:hypothetical protein
MQDRSEPRFKTETPATIQVIRDKARALDCTITDISAAGFQLSMAEPLQPGEFVRVLVDGVNTISVVRRCFPSAPGFAVGLERVDDWAPGEQWEERVAAGRAKSLKNPVGDLRSAAMHNLFGYREILGRRISPKTFSFMLAGSAMLAVLSVGIAVMPKQHPPAAAAVKAAEAKKPAEAPVAAATETKLPETKVPETKVQSVPATVSNAANATPPVAAKVATPNPVQPPVAAAKNPPVANQAAQSVKEKPVSAPVLTPAVSAPKPTAANNSPAPAVKPAVPNNPPTTPAATTKVAASSAVATPANPVSPVSTAPSAGSHSLSITASDMSWVAACADGKKVFENVMNAGSKAEVRFSQEAVVRSGNAGALAITMGNQHLDAMGQRGVKLWLNASPSSLNVVSTPIAGPCAGK